MKVTTMLASLAAVVLLTACEDVFEDGSLQPDGSKPNLTIQNPKNNQSVSKAEGVKIKFTAVDKDKVKELHVRVRGEGAETNLVDFTTFPDEKVIDLDTLFSASGIAPGTYRLTIEATDHRTNFASKEVTFKVK